MSNIFPNIKERVLYLILQKGYKREEFFRIIGMTYGNFTGKAKETPLNSSALSNILLEIPDVNPEWLITGNGEMLKEGTKTMISETQTHTETEKQKEIPLISIDSISSYNEIDNKKTEGIAINQYKIPELEGKGVKYLIRNSGSSMQPLYNNGDLLACKPLSDISFFQWGKTYVLETEQGTIVKRLFPCQDDSESIECHSDNSINYPPFTIPKSSIINVAIVVGVIRLE
ncbi:hypothetical protein L0669_11045 [Flavobacterium bizetiae]|uniref:S24 family peptidase n=1 Tax=Flavobacterium bizetiae TaxID=2704140 RepID=UPI0021E7D5B5|nr:S24 family peptidase [Flavobacterium bizetiae]UTN06420.1 hypothetical protein L0669_11045 [Flavobacterium bizetiae]